MPPDLSVAGSFDGSSSEFPKNRQKSTTPPHFTVWPKRRVPKREVKGTGLEPVAHGRGAAQFRGHDRPDHSAHNTPIRDSRAAEPAQARALEGLGARQHRPRLPP